MPPRLTLAPLSDAELDADAVVTQGDALDAARQARADIRRGGAGAPGRPDLARLLDASDDDPGALADGAGMPPAPSA